MRGRRSGHDPLEQARTLLAQEVAERRRDRRQPLGAAVHDVPLLDVQGFPLMRNWYVVHRRTKRLPPVAQAFKEFLLTDGTALIEKIVPFDPQV